MSGARIPDFTWVQWQPISQLTVFGPLIGGLLAETLAFQSTLAGATGGTQAQCHLKHVQRQYCERSDFLDLYEEQVRRWRAPGLTLEQERISAEVQQTRPMIGQVLALVDQLREDTIDLTLRTGQAARPSRPRSAGPAPPGTPARPAPGSARPGARSRARPGCPAPSP